MSTFTGASSPRARVWLAGVVILATSAPIAAQVANASAVKASREYVARLKKVMPPAKITLASCPAEGRDAITRAGNRARIDTVTDLIKNRVQEGDYQPVSVDQILALPGKTGLPTQRFQWTKADADTVARYEGAPVVVEGYLIGLRVQGPENTNCDIADARWRDWHIWLVATEAEAMRRDKTRAVVAEATPRVRLMMPQADRGLSQQQIQMWVQRGRRVRVKGWLMHDPDHPNEVGKSRGTTWEVHPVMRIEPVSGPR
jgi:hypothetical protein